MIFCDGEVRAAESGQLTRDITVGANHDVPLKTGQTLQVMKESGTTAVIMVQMPDGSNGVFQVDASAVQVATPSALPSAPSSAPAVAPAPVTQPVPAAPPTPVATAPAPVPTTPAVPTPSTSTASTTPPTYPDDFVGGPQFETTVGTQAAGTASVVKLKDGDQCYIVSARHLLGPEGGFAKQTAAKDVPDVVKSIHLHAFSGGSQSYDVTGLLVPATRLKADGGAPVDDMAIYRLHDASLQKRAVVLTGEVPAVGATVWVVAHVRGGVPEGEIMHSGKISFNTKWLIMQFDNDNIITAGASGAPVLNAAGAVVGVYSGHLQKDGHMLGFIIPSVLIAQTIKNQATTTP